MEATKFYSLIAFANYNRVSFYGAPIDRRFRGISAGIVSPFFPSAVITPRDDKWTARHRCSFVRFVTSLCVPPTDEFLSGICNNRSDVSPGKRRDTVSVLERVRGSVNVLFSSTGHCNRAI